MSELSDPINFPSLYKQVKHSYLRQFSVDNSPPPTIHRRKIHRRKIHRRKIHRRKIHRRKIHRRKIRRRKIRRRKIVG